LTERSSGHPSPPSQGETILSVLNSYLIQWGGLKREYYLV
jgi:hypothetical protein